MAVYQHLDPRQITIRRDTRQRQENIADVEDLKQSINAIGIINPIVVRREDSEIILVAGERRLKASLELDLPLIPITYFEDLSVEEAEIVELEENLKRKELHWKDQVRALGRIHKLYSDKNETWTVDKTAMAVSLTPKYLYQVLRVFKELDTGRITRADSIDAAYNTIQKFAERKAESIVSDLIAQSAQLFGDIGDKIANETTITSTDFITVPAVALAGENPPAQETFVPASSPPPPTPTKPTSTDPVICVNFAEWIKTYSGPKFSLIHCDFPYGNYRGGDSQGALGGLDTENFYDNTESVYWNLLDILISGLDQVMSYSAHLVFWFNMNFYTETVSRLRRAGLMIHDHPLVWHKTGGPGGLGVAPGTDSTYPRRTYDTALLGVRGSRPLVRSMCNSYQAPTAGNKIHPSQKPEPMLRYFLQMVVDETTTMLDPTCGSAAALRAAEDLGARSVLGLEMDPNYARDANTKTLQARVMRQAGALRREDML